MTQLTSPLETYIRDQTEHFTSESKRLRTKAPLVEWNSLLNAFAEVDQSIGTLRHDVGLDILKKQFKLAGHEAFASWRGMWTGFRKVRKEAAVLRKRERQNRKEAFAELQNLEVVVSKAQISDHSVSAAMQSVLQVCREASEADLEVSSLVKKFSWVRLWIDGRIFTIYLLYMLHRARVLFLFHAFIMLVPIIIFGIGYSAVAKSLFELLAKFGATLPWVITATLLSYIIKKYYLDKKLKAVQKRFETRLLRPLNARLFLVRALALQIDTARRG